MINNIYRINQLFAAMLLLVACTLIQAKTYEVSTVVDDLEYPWSIAFLANNEMLVTERNGRLRLIKNGQLIAQKISGLPEIYVNSQGGLFDVILDPNFATNQTLYLSYSAGTKNKNTLKVISAQLDGMSLQQVKVILTITPTRDTPNHYGARMAFLPDNTLLVTSGDGFDFREQAQSLNSMLGKVLRINTDGTIPKDNPFAEKEINDKKLNDKKTMGQKNIRPEIYSFGHRNAQGIIVSQSGKIWLHEHGPKGGDELNLITAGKNYGWPAITYGVDYSGAIISPFTEAEGMEQPITYWVPSIAPAGMTEYQGSIFPQWNGNLFISALAERSVRRLIVKDNKVIEQEIMLKELKQRIRDIRTGPDGYLYVLTDSKQGSVLKLSPVGHP